TTSSAPGYRCGNQRSLPKVATATVSVPSGRSVGVGCAEEIVSGHMHATRLTTTNHGRRTIALPPLHLTCHDGVDSEPAGLLTAPATPFQSSDGVYRQRSYWIPGSYAPALSEKPNAFLRLLKNKGFKEKSITKVAQFLGVCSSAKTCEMDENLLSMSE